MLTVDGIEIENRWTEYGVKGPMSGEILDCDSEEEAILLADAFDSHAEVVVRQVFETAWGCRVGI
jgi:hypothetical protein